MPEHDIPHIRSFLSMRSQLYGMIGFMVLFVTLIGIVVIVQIKNLTTEVDALSYQNDMFFGVVDAINHVQSTIEQEQWKLQSPQDFQAYQQQHDQLVSKLEALLEQANSAEHLNAFADLLTHFEEVFEEVESYKYHKRRQELIDIENLEEQIEAQLHQGAQTSHEIYFGIQETLRNQLQSVRKDGQETKSVFFYVTWLGLLIPLVFSILMAKNILKPFQKLIQFASRLSPDVSESERVKDSDEIGYLSSFIQKLQKELDWSQFVSDRILKNIDQAVFFFRNEQDAATIYSEHTKIIFDENIVHMNALQVLSQGLVEEKRQALSEVLMLIFQNPSDFNTLGSFLPKQIRYHGLCLDARYSLANKDEQSFLMIQIYDVTSLALLEEKIQELDKQNHMIEKVISDAYGFIQFYRELQNTWSFIYGILAAPVNEDALIQLSQLYKKIEIRAIFHGLDELSTAVRAMHQQVKVAMKHQEQPNNELFSKLLKQSFKVQEQLAKEICQLHPIVSVEELEVSELLIQVTDTQLEAFEKFLEGNVSAEEFPLFQKQLHLLKAQPIGSMLRRYISTISSCAAQHNKKVDVEMSGYAILISYETLGRCLLTLVPFLKEVIILEVEPPEVRSMMGKVEHAFIRIDVRIEASEDINCSAEQLVIEIFVDGWGELPDYLSRSEQQAYHDSSFGLLKLGLEDVKGSLETEFEANQYSKIILKIPYFHP